MPVDVFAGNRMVASPARVRSEDYGAVPAMRAFRSRCLTVLLFATAYACSLPAETPTAAENSGKARAFLQHYLNGSDDKTARYSAAFVELKGNGPKDVIVYFTDQRMCGTGGCSMLILAPEGASYRLVTSVTIAWPAIRVLKTKSHGWHEIGVWVQGGGIQPGYEGVLSYDGKSYRSNPSVPPARAASPLLEGNTVIPALSEGVPVY